LRCPAARCRRRGSGTPRCPSPAGASRRPAPPPPATVSVASAVELVDPHARQPLNEINTGLLLGTGEATATGVRRRRGGAEAIWALSWPEQQGGRDQPDSHPRLLRCRSAPPASAGRHRR